MSKTPDFWMTSGTSLAAILLAPLGWIYGRVSGQRMLSRPKATSNLPVVCIGNFVVGGTGKTPFSLELAECLSEEGYRPGFLLRGYGGRQKQPLLVDPDRHTAAAVGDEALLLAQEAPTIVSADRVAGARLAEQQDIDLLIMDDGFQNPALKKDLSLVLVDAATGFGNGFCLPAGPLRAPPAMQILKTDCLVIVGEGEAAEDAVHLAARKGLPILHAHLVPQVNEKLEGQELYAFAGIGRPQKFFSTLEAMGCELKKTRSFADHHQYSAAEVRSLLTEADELGLQLVTTAKDMARLKTSDGEIFHWIESRAEVLDVDMKIDDTERLMSLIREKLRNLAFSK
ncbi:MAG: tetraacyldisaccharide 4'-kinase [Roseibium sp.]|nr:tetraacyldisaccharide 4'-kinase [Roseibium sp.]